MLEYRPEYNVDRKDLERSLEYHTDQCIKKKCTVSLHWMSPQQFMSMVPDSCGAQRCDRAGEEFFDRGSLAKLTERLERGLPVDPLFLDLTTRRILKSGVTDEYLNMYEHEGRHRAFVARKLGIDLVPVVLVQDRNSVQRCLIKKV